MRRILQTLSILALLLAGAAAADAQISFDVQLGTPPPAPRAYRVPRQPGPDYVWVDGYWLPANGQYRWHEGYWTRPPYPDAYWVAPFYQEGRYYTGRWEGSRGDVHHDHRWDQNGQRDERWGAQAESPRGRSGADRMIEVKVSFDTDRGRALEDTKHWAALALSAEEKMHVEDPLEMERLADALPAERAAHPRGAARLSKC